VNRRRVQPPPPRKSIGAELSWGIRFDGAEEAERFLDKLAEEVWARMAAAGVRGRNLALKLKRRKQACFRMVLAGVGWGGEVQGVGVRGDCGRDGAGSWIGDR
jgi:impB/mucB/samB family C-terminal domain